MALFTVEVAGRPVLVFSEDSRDAAEELATSLIGPDLQDFESGGRPIWDGQSALSVREADSGEAARWQKGFEEAQDEGATGDEPEEFAVFLVELDAEEDDEEEDDEEA